jgi:hypothetical protein
MKLIRFGAYSALLAGTALIGCSSSDSPNSGSGDSSVGLKLRTTQGVVITEVNWDLNTSPGNADVANDSIPVPNDNSVVNVSIQSLPGGTYSLVFSATGTYTPMSGPTQTVPCVSAPTVFTLAPSTNLTLPPVDLVCQIEGQVADTTGGVEADVNVVVETINVDNNIVQVFSYGPRTVSGLLQMDGTCSYPPIKLKVHNPNPAIAYSWAVNPTSAGTFSPANVSTEGTFTCTQDGAHALTITATQGAVVASKTVTVTCNLGNCAPPICGDGEVNGTDECDDSTQRCQNCIIVPVCGDGVQDGPNGNCFGTNLSKPECDEQCDTAGPSATCTAECTAPVFCGDGVVNQPSEVCDNGMANSDTVADACRTNCQPASCGDGVQDTGEACDGGPNCNPDCTTAGPGPGPCGDGVVNTGEQCDDGLTAGISPANGCTGSCDTLATCFSCIEAAPETSALQSDYCVAGFPNGECVQVETCYLDTACWYPVPANCYCGPDTSANCEAETFVPTGPCVSIIRSTTGNVSNADTLARMPLPTFATGIAQIVLNESVTPCGGQCFDIP